MTAKDVLDKRYKSLETNQRVQSAISKATALSMFKSTHEPEANYTYLSVDKNQLNHIGIEYIDLGCRYFETEDYTLSSSCLSKGAECLEFIHSHEENGQSFRDYYGLLASMAFYAGFQYSRAFVLIKKFEEETLIASLISLFLKRNFEELTDKVERMEVSKEFEDKKLSLADDIDDACGKVFEINIAKSLYCIIQYFYTGDETLIGKAKEKLNVLLDIAKIEEMVDLWWVVRLILIIVDGFRQSSLWHVLGTYFNVKDDDSLAKRYIQSLIYKTTPVTELFLSQRPVLSQLFDVDSQGVIVSIPTSSGKTRIAEVSILKAIVENTEKKILYIAPFRSLAYEIEKSLGDLFAAAKIKVTHLYGGSLFTSLDVEELSEANIVIATPEKTKAIFRCQQDFFKELSLVIMDEGHLLGMDKRQIGHEIFYEELKAFLKDVDCKYLLLSAVLPNSEDLSEWLTGTDGNVYHNDWRPSKQICGILNWNGVSVDLEWYNGNTVSSFNHNFIVRHELPRRPRERVKHYYPKNKTEAIVETTRKLESLGSTLIYVPMKQSCKTYAEAYAKSVQNEQPYIFKNEIERRIFELTCKESYSNTDVYDYAINGIFFHNADLFTDVRISMEKLMQTEHPRVIIATSTLSQGVNLGVSTVIMSSVLNSGLFLSKKDFWNLAGRAGRAFVDEEGKVLVAFEYNSKKKKRQNDWAKNRIEEYFDNTSLELVASGILKIISFIHKLAEKSGIAFCKLLERIADNKPLPEDDTLPDIEELMSQLDDCLLSMHEEYSEDREKMDWIEVVFSKSLAYIQAEKNTFENVVPENVISFVKSRVAGIIKKIQSEDTWGRLVQSGLPLLQSIEIDAIIDKVIKIVEEYRISCQSTDEKIMLLKNIEELILTQSSFKNKYVKLDRIDEIREKWLKGIPLCDMKLITKDEMEIIQKYYSYELPWFLNGMASMIKSLEDFDEEYSNLLSELALLVETGLPNKKAVKVYRSGVRSRACATEFSDFMTEIMFGEYYPSNLVKTEIIRLSSSWKKLSERGRAWIEILEEEQKIKQGNRIMPISSFSIKNDKKELSTFKVRIIDGQKYFLSLDLENIMPMNPSERDFSQIEHLKGIYFEYNKGMEEYEMKILNPYIRIQK